MKIFKIYNANNLLNNILLFLITILVGILTVINISLIKDILNIGIIEKDSIVLNKGMSKLIIISIILLFLNMMLPVVKNITYWKGITNLMHAVMSTTFKAKYSEGFQKKDSSKLWTDINLSTSYTAMYYDALINMVYRIIKFLIYFSVLIAIDFYASMIVAVVFMINLIFVHKVKKKLKYYQEQFLQLSQNLSARVIESINLIRNIKAKNKEDYFVERISESQHELNNNIISNSLIQDFSNNLIEFIVNVTPIVAVIVILSLSNKAFNSIGSIVVVYSYIPLVLGALQESYSLLLQMLSSKPYLASLKSMLDIEVESLGEKNIHSFEKLEVQDLEVHLDSENWVKIKDFTINKGERILIYGASGCGKTTLFNVLMGFINNYTGTIKVNNIDIKLFKLADLRKVFGIVLQENRVFNLPFEEVIKLSTDNNMDSILRICEIEETYRNNDLGWINTDKLSGGEKARINLAQTLIREPDVLFIDEALSALDVEMEARILESIMKTYQGMTIIYISHRKTASKIFDKEIFVV